MITRMWAHDGWCYIPQLNQRQKFFTLDSPSRFQLEIQEWRGVIPRPLHSEQLKYRRLAQSAWQEESAYWGAELYEETSPNTSTPCH